MVEIKSKKKKKNMVEINYMITLSEKKSRHENNILYKFQTA